MKYRSYGIIASVKLKQPLILGTRILFNVHSSVQRDILFVAFDEGRTLPNLLGYL